jgi:hypothetical protein
MFRHLRYLFVHLVMILMSCIIYMMNYLLIDFFQYFENFVKSLMVDHKVVVKDAIS